MMALKKSLFFLFIIISFCAKAQPSGNNRLLHKGWESLVKDDDNLAFKYLWKAYEDAKKENNVSDTAESLLFLASALMDQATKKDFGMLQHR